MGSGGERMAYRCFPAVLGRFARNLSPLCFFPIARLRFHRCVTRDSKVKELEFLHPTPPYRKINIEHRADQEKPRIQRRQIRHITDRCWSLISVRQMLA
ncbi:hypothetical protein BJX64DRAFT_151413 [Aspergillus heterothallicus]